MTKLTAVVALAVFAGAASADDWTIAITCDNQFDIYFGGSTSTSFVAGGGASWPTTYNYTALNRPGSDYVYVTTASDHSVAQGLIADFTNTTLGLTTSTGAAVWEVFPAGRYLSQLGFTNPWPANLQPTQAQTDAAIAYAENNGLWIPTSTNPSNNLNGVTPWGFRSGISAGARWIWHRAPNGPADPLRGGFNHEEFLVFRIPGAVPTPGVLGILAGAGILVGRRRR
mgnify:CR=1 FL=1